MLAAAGYLIKNNVNVHGQLRSRLEKVFDNLRRNLTTNFYDCFIVNSGSHLAAQKFSARIVRVTEIRYRWSRRLCKILCVKSEGLTLKCF